MAHRDRRLLRDLLGLTATQRDPLLLAALAETLPADVHELAVEIARTFPPDARALTLAGLGRAAEAHAAAREISDVRQRARVLARLVATAPDPEAVSAQVLELIFDGTGYNVDLAADLGSLLTPTARATAARRLVHGGAYPSLYALWQLVPHLDEATLDELADLAIAAGPGHYLLLERLNRPASPKQARRIAAAIMDLDDRAFGLDLRRAVPYLPAGAIGPLARRTTRIENQFYRQYAIEALAPVADAATLADLRAALRDDMRNPEAEFEVALREFELSPNPATARNFEKFLWRRHLTPALHARLRELPPDALGLLIDVAPDADSRDFLLSVPEPGSTRSPVAAAIEAAVRDIDLVPEASALIESGTLGTAETVDGDAMRAFGYIQLIRRLPAGNRAALVYRAIELIHAADRLVIRCWLLTRLFDVLTMPERVAALPAVTSELRPLADSVREALRTELTRLLAVIPMREGLAAIQLFLTGFQRVTDDATRVLMFCVPQPDRDHRPLAEMLARPVERNPYLPVHLGVDDSPPPGPVRVPDWTRTGPSPTEPGPAVVSTGFAPVDRPGEPVDPNRTLVAGSRLLFWLDIGSAVAGSIEAAPAPLPAAVPAGAELTVAVFGGEIEIDPAAALGQLRLTADGSAVVSRAAAPLDDPARLYFPVRLPATPGLSTLRCNIYWNRVLVESRLVEVWTGVTPGHRTGALRSTVDYRIADLTDFGSLSAIPAHAASLMHDTATHSLHVLTTDGAELLRADAKIESAQLTSQIRMARSALGRVAWGNDQPWRPGMANRYAQPAGDEQLAEDLGLLAVNGYRLHHLLMRALAQAAGSDAFEFGTRLGAALAAPGFVQVALNESANHVLPAAILYDFPLDTNAETMRLCPEFLAHRENARCFDHTCRPGPTVVCPGGFWGFRHALGLPVSLGSATPPPQSLGNGGPTRFTAGVYRDFDTAPGHCGNLRTLAALDWRMADDREALFHELTDREPEIVYFYCHGGVQDDLPYLRVGRGMTGPVITPDNFYQRGVRWASARPLVFLNGCRTAELSPERAIDFVSYFVEDALASGVVGTEITVFEQFAAEFAEECLRLFFAGLPIGKAVTGARIHLLAKGNPLGLAYIPFVLPSIRLAVGQPG